MSEGISNGERPKVESQSYQFMERRSGRELRSENDRRDFNDPRVPCRRSGKERRSGKDRRNSSKYLFLDEKLNFETRDRCKWTIEKSIINQSVNCLCDDLRVIVNFKDNFGTRFGTMVRCECGDLKPVTFYFSLG